MADLLFRVAANLQSQPSKPSQALTFERPAPQPCPTPDTFNDEHLLYGKSVNFGEDEDSSDMSPSTKVAVLANSVFTRFMKKRTNNEYTLKCGPCNNIATGFCSGCSNVHFCKSCYKEHHTEKPIGHKFFLY
jgi:hypothetical protein